MADAGGSSSLDRHKPKIVYRGDTRPPPEIFHNGFQARGAVDDLMAHVKGGPNLDDSGYISTSQSLRTPAAFIHGNRADTYSVPDHQEISYTRRIGWIYHINTTDLNMFYIPDLLPPKQEKTYGYQQEWAVKGSIPGKNIQQAHRVDGYIKNYVGTVRSGGPNPIDPIFPPDKPTPFKEITMNEHYKYPHQHEEKK